MKMKFTLVLAAVAASTAGTLQPVNAQTWQLAGNNATTDSSRLGTNNNIPLRLFTFNKEKMRITTDGKVGIGIKIPNAMLHVKGTASRIATFDGGTNMYAEVNENGSPRGYFGSVAGNSQDFDLGTNSLNNSGKLHLTIRAIPKLTINADGKVGIGTINPTTFLSVVRTGAEATADFRNTTLGPNISWIHFGPTGDWYIRSAANNGNVILQDQSVNGKVGIGTTRPFRKLEVRDGDIRIKTNDAPRFLEFLDDAPDHDDYRFQHLNLDIGDDGNEFPYSALIVKSSTDNFNSNDIAIASFSKGGSFSVYGTGFANEWREWSDARLKKEVNNFGSALDIVKKLQPKTYLFKTEEYTTLNLPKEKRYGFLAQDLEKVLPELVTTSKEALRIDATGKSKIEELKAVNYTELIPILTKAIQEQQAQIEELQKVITKLSGSPIIGTTITEGTQSSTVFITNASVEQNKPNPFTNSTSISYNIPDGSKKSELIITDNTGKTIKQVALPSGSSGIVNLEATLLGSGTYQYSLYVDGRLIETKKMVVVR